MNSLIQVMFMIPEVRACMLELTPQELYIKGYVEVVLISYKKEDQKDKKPKTIAIELQRLFAKLFHLEKSYISTEDLTKAFGWSTRDCYFEQHDVQELNRFFCI
jgi:hypothetical protein